MILPPSRAMLEALGVYRRAIAGPAVKEWVCACR
jgi:hypothetical protein